MSIIIPFTKMNGAGNDFIVLDTIANNIRLSAAKIRFIADRHFGIGADQVLLVARSESSTADFAYRIFNQDGGEVEQCGNGARCFMRFIHDKGLTQQRQVRVQTMNGLIDLYLEHNGEVKVNMGVPRWGATALPFAPQELRATQQDCVYMLGLSSHIPPERELGLVSMGNPHAVLRVPIHDGGEVESVGMAIQAHPAFPKSVNVGFMVVESNTRIALRVYERGVGETLACGSGACAAVVIGIVRAWLLPNTPIAVDMPGGTLSLSWGGEGTPVWMTGPASTVFEGRIEIPEDVDLPQRFLF